MSKIIRQDTYRHGDEFSVEFFVVDDSGKRLFSPGAEVTVDRRFGKTQREVQIGWASSDSKKTFEDGVLQAKVMAEAVAFAEQMADEINGPE